MDNNKVRTITVPPERLKRMLAVMMMMNRKRKVLMLTLLR